MLWAWLWDCRRAALAQRWLTLWEQPGSAVAASGNARPLRGGGRAQVGEFYEAQGTDAVMLVQWASLNPMGRKPPPRAGAPVVNLRRTLDDILQGSGLSIVRSRCPAYGCRAGHGCWDPRLTQMAGWNSP